ncbi:MAG: hypothetical protein RLZZ319_545, partial [Actinomycetota bacterium]
MSDARDGHDGRGTTGRRSSFVPPKDANSDYVPSLPPVGSAPIPSASDVNYFPSVQTGAPQLSQPAPPARLVVPTRQSLTEEEIATRFAESMEMSSTEQIVLLDSQMTLREADIATAKDFYSQLRLANPREAAPLLAELKAKFGDLDESILEMAISVGDTVVDGPAVGEPTVTEIVEASTNAVAIADSVIDSAIAPEPVAPVIAEPIPTPASSSVDASATVVLDPETAMLGRYRGWSALLSIAVTIAALIPAGFAIFTVFGAPVPDLVDELLGSTGAFVAGFALLVSIPLVLMARSTAFRHGLGWRGAMIRVFGSGGGTILSVLAGIGVIASVLGILFTAGQAIGTQLGSVDVVAQLASSIVPSAHLSVLVVGALLVVGTILGVLPRRLFRATMLALTGFVIAGPSVLILQGIAIAANTDAGAISLDNVVIATAIVPLVLVLIASTESGIAAVTSHDENKIHGLWLYIGLALGVGFSAWTLVDGYAASAGGDLFVGANPVLHFVASTEFLAIVFSTITVAIPLVLLVALIVRHLLMATVSSDRLPPPVWLRIVTVVVPIAIVALDAVGALPDPVTALPGVAFASVPVLVVVGALAGASVAVKRVIGGGARITLTIVSSLLIVVGLVATTWSVPSLAGAYEQSVAPLA